MKEYQDIINIYSLKGYEMYAKTNELTDWGNKEVASRYLDRYWLGQLEYERKWRPIMQQIFEDKTLGLPEKIFKPEFQLIAFAGGRVFSEYEYLQLQQCMLELGDKEFVVVENHQISQTNQPFYRMKFSVGTSWDELRSGNFASTMWLDSIHKEFFVFGDSFRWGRYSANDYDYPVDIIGTKEAELHVFRKMFVQSPSELQEVIDNLPKYYQNKILHI